jgi:hypothetical protein
MLVACGVCTAREYAGMVASVAQSTRIELMTRSTHQGSTLRQKAAARGAAGWGGDGAGRAVSRQYGAAACSTAVALLFASSVLRFPHQNAHRPSSLVKKQELGPNCQAANTVVENTQEQRKSTRRMGMRRSL